MAVIKPTDCSYVTLPVASAADALPILVAISADETAKLFDFMLLFYALYTLLYITTHK